MLRVSGAPAVSEQEQFVAALERARDDARCGRDRPDRIPVSEERLMRCNARADTLSNHRIEAGLLMHLPSVPGVQVIQIESGAFAAGSNLPGGNRHARPCLDTGSRKGGFVAARLQAGRLVTNSENNRKDQGVGGDLQIEVHRAVNKYRQRASDAAEQDSALVAARI